MENQSILIEKNHSVSRMGMLLGTVLCINIGFVKKEQLKQQNWKFGIAWGDLQVPKLK